MVIQVVSPELLLLNLPSFVVFHCASTQPIEDAPQMGNRRNSTGLLFSSCIALYRVTLWETDTKNAGTPLAKHYQVIYDLRAEQLRDHSKMHSTTKRRVLEDELAKADDEDVDWADEVCDGVCVCGAGCQPLWVPWATCLTLSAEASPRAISELCACLFATNPYLFRWCPFCVDCIACCKSSSAEECLLKASTTLLHTAWLILGAEVGIGQLCA